MLHDGELQRVAGSQHARRIGHLTAGEAECIDVGSWFGPHFAAERIPRLAHVLLRYRDRAHLHVVRGKDVAIDSHCKAACCW